jgi:membrane associated rhomboid family serine protease
MTTPETCFHHTDRETGRHCTRCGRPACADCLRQASVGSHCFECVREGQTPRATRVRRQLRGTSLPVTKTIILINVAVFMFMTFRTGSLDAGTRQADWALFAPAIANGEWYRLITSGFIHYGLLHIGFNMLILYQVGLVLEPGAGSARFGSLYFASLLTGSLGALIASPNALTGGASGAVFGVAAAATLALYRQGVGFWNTGFGPLLVFDLVLSFVLPNISYGGHIGGLIGGALVAEGMVQARKAGRPWLGYVGAAVVAVVAFVASLIVASNA